MKNLTTQTLKIFWQHAKKYPWQIFFIVFGVLTHIALQNASPILYKKLIDTVIGGSPSNIQPMLNVVKLIFIVAIFRFAAARGFNFVNNNFQPRVMADLLNTCFEYLQKHSYSFFSNSFVGSLVTKVKRYERSFETITDQLIFELGRTFVETFLILGVLFYEAPIVGWMTFSWVILYLIFSYFFSMYKLPVDIKRAQIDSSVTARLADSITNNFNIKTFAGYEMENRAFTTETGGQFKIRRRSWNLGTISDLIQAASMILLEFLVMYTAVTLWSRGAITVGTIALIQNYFIRLFDKYWSIGKNIRNVYEAMADGNEMTEILLTPHEVQDKPNAKQLKVRSGHIKFQNLDFRYENNANILNRFNLTIKAGERVALIGPSGGGKSTIVKLLFRFHDIQGGQILIDNQDIASVTQDSLRLNMSLVPQEPILFHRSLLENIRYGKPDATDDEVIAAAKAAHAHEFIGRSKDGYQTYVGERGMKLSGGERQRVAIARAILKNAPILVLDEATSSLDSESEYYIQNALKKLMHGKTVIVIAHRLSTIMQMDRIVVLENGNIREQGKHEELLKVEQGTYQKLWGIQAGGFTTVNS